MRSWTVGARIVVLVGAAVLSSRLASAQAPLEYSLDVDVEAPTRCATQPGITAAITRILGPPAETDTPALRVQVEANITDAAGRATLELRVRLSRSGSEPTTGHRSLSSARCDSFVETLAVLVALAVDPSRASAPTTPTTPTTPPDAPEPSEPAPATPRTPRTTGDTDEAPAPDASRSRPIANLGGALGATGGRLPAVTPTAELVARLRLGGAWWAAVRATGAWPSREEFADGDVRIDTFGAAAQLELRVVDGPWSAGPLGGIALEWLWARASGFAEATSATSLVVLGEIGAFTSVRLSDDWALRADGALAGTARRARFVVEGLGVVHRPDALGGRVTVGIDYVFGR